METAQASSRKQTARRRPRAQQNRSVSPLGETVCRSVVELAPDAIVVADGNGRIVLLNQQAEILFGAARAALLRQPIECLLPARFHTRHEQHRSHYQVAPRPRPMGTPLALFGQRQDGSEFPVEVSLSPLQVSDELLIISTIRDITARRALEAQAQAAERLKDEFIALTAHELRTPIATIAGYAQALERPRLQDVELSDAEWLAWQAEAQQAILKATSRLIQLADDLLEVAQIQAGQLTLQQEPHDLVALARRTAKRLQATTTQHTLSVVADAEYVVALIDRGRIEQVLMHLLANALHYSPAGGAITVILSTHATTGLAEVAVADHGIGIPAAEQAHVFERFVRATNAQQVGVEGKGLGLYLCRELVERHGGRLWVASSEGQGSTFFFSVPLAEDDEVDCTY
ncbi:MAG TPA: ATP-binding protein [Ktedonobacterales bacterium]|nr:ATP-binding protein [Ktedonobacterales bacterium]